MIRNFFNDNNIRLIFKSGVFTFMAKILGVIFSFVVTYIISKNYGAETLGIIALLNTIITLVLIFTTFGLETTIIKLFPKFYIKNSLFILYKKVIFISFIVLFFVSVILYFSFNKIAEVIFHKPVLNYFIFFIILSIMFKTFYKLNIAFIRGLKLVRVYAILQMLPMLIVLLLLLVLMKMDSDPYLPIYIHLLSPFVLVVITCFILYQVLTKSKNYTKISIKEIITISIPLLLSSSFSFISTQTDVIMLGMFSSSLELGIYSLVVKLVSLIIFINVSMNSMIVPKLSEAYTEKDFDKLKSISKKSTALIFWISFPIVLILVVFGKYILLIFGKEFINAYTPLLLIVFGQMINSFSGPNAHFLNMTGYHKKATFIVGLSAVINIILNYLLIPRYGITGAAFATMISYIVWNILANYYIKKYFGFVLFYIPFLRSKNVKKT